MELTRAQVIELKMARKIAFNIQCVAYDQTKWRREDPNVFARGIERKAEQVVHIHDRIFGEDDE